MIIVPPSGPTSAKIVLVGEAPGKEEELQLKPFVGGSGQLLTELLIKAGIHRDECYITNVVKIRPPGNNFDVYYHDGEKRCQPTDFLKTSIAALHDELSTLKPNLIIPLGDEALRAVSGHRGIGKWRGSVISSPYGKCLPTFHPAAVLRTWAEKPIVQLDLNKAAKEAAYPDIRLLERHLSVRPTFSQVLEYIEKVKTSPSKRFAFDIETTGPHVRCLGLSCERTSALCIPFFGRANASPSFVPPEVLELSLNKRSITELYESLPGRQYENYWSEAEERIILERLQEIFLDPTLKRVGQNLSYDLTVLANEFGLYVHSVYMDTMNAQHCCYCEFPKGLDFLCSIYTDIPYYSDYDSYDDDQTWKYNCYDCVGTYEVSEKLDNELRVRKQTEFYFNHVHPTCTALYNIQTRGFKVNRKLREERRTEAVKELETVAASAATMTGIPGFNPNSHVQMKAYLYQALRLPPQFDGHGEAKKLTTKESAIVKLAFKFPQHKDFFDVVLKYREYKKLIGTYYDNPISDDDRIYTSYNAAGTVTRRFSSSEFGYAVAIILPSTNLQNPPKGKFRQIFVAESDDYWLLKADLSQAEFRIVVWLAGIQRIIQKYVLDPPYVPFDPSHKSFDVHTWVASLIFQIPEDKVVKKVENGLSQRDIAKNGVYGGNYAMEAERASQVYKMPFSVAEFVLKAYRRTIPEIPQWWEFVQRTLRLTRTIVSPSGASRTFFDRLDDELFRSAYSHSAQSIVSDLINRALHLAEFHFNDQECCVLGQVHDELVFRCLKSKLDYYGPKILGLMEYPLWFPNVTNHPLIIPAELSYGPNWYDQTKYEPHKAKDSSCDRPSPCPSLLESSISPSSVQ
jgi:uracil-DNA glycosylase